MKPFIDAIGIFLQQSKPSTAPAEAGFARRLCAPSRAHLFVRGRPADMDAAAPVTATSPDSAPAAV